MISCGGMDGTYCQRMIGAVAGALLRSKIISSPIILRAIPVNVLFVAIMQKNFGIKGNVCFKMLK